uniref:Secreted protein n=1 Tax=Strongyloides papillosus TaxID=174720 RepID=A0A0N5BKR4_STREA
MTRFRNFKMKIFFLFILLCAKCYGLDFEILFEDVFQRMNLNQSAYRNFLESMYLSDHSVLEIMRNSFLQNENTFFNVSTVSEDCNEDMDLIVRTINESTFYDIDGNIKINSNNSIIKNVVLPMIDSAGKIPVGFLEGSFISHGLC